jgi:hypothetical protein
MADHVRWNLESDMLVCENCGDKMPMLYGRLNTVSRIARLFGTAHKKCKPGDAGSILYAKHVKAKEQR